MHLIFIYLGVFIAIFFEGEMVMVSAVIAAHNDYLDLWMVILIGFVATYTSDLFYFFIGRKRGQIWLRRNDAIHKRALIIQQKIEKYPVVIFISYRFLYGIRTIAPIVIGTGSMKTKTFILYSALSTLLWTLVISVIGYAFSAVIESQLKHIEHIEKYFMGGLILLGTVLFWIFHTRRKKQ